MTITALPSAPAPTDSRATFKAKAFAWVAALATWITEVNALEANVEALEASATTSAASAAADAASANAAVDADLWAVGTVYAQGEAAKSGITFNIYHRTVAGAGGVDPANDTTGTWVAYEQPVPLIVVTGNMAVVPFSEHKVIAAADLTLPPNPRVGEWFIVWMHTSLTVNLLRNGNNINGTADNRFLGTVKRRYLYKYEDTTTGWGVSASR